MPDALEISLTQKSGNDGLRRTLRLHKTGTTADGDQEFFFDLIGDHAHAAPTVLDGFVLALLIAMQMGRPVRVHGSLSRSTCFNLAEFQSAWACWKPKKYRRVDIVPDDIIDLPALEHPPRAIQPFPEGSTAPSLRYATNSSCWATAPTRLPMYCWYMVLTYRLASPNPSNLLRRVRPLVNELGLGMKVIRTNLKEASGQDWEDSFGAQLAACLHNYSNDYNYALMGNDEPYTNIIYPWGSTPITNY